MDFIFVLFFLLAAGETKTPGKGSVWNADADFEMRGTCEATRQGNTWQIKATMEIKGLVFGEDGKLVSSATGKGKIASASFCPLQGEEEEIQGKLTGQEFSASVTAEDTALVVSVKVPEGTVVDYGPLGTRRLPMDGLSLRANIKPEMVTSGKPFATLSSFHWRKGEGSFSMELLPSR